MNALAQTAPHAESALSPADELATLIGWATALFFAAEADHNPGVKTIWDAYHYVTTALSVGYANIFPVTPAGKVIGGIVMTIGPALSGMALEGKRAESGDCQVNGGGDAAVVAKLDEVLVELRKLTSPAAGAEGQSPSR